MNATPLAAALIRPDWPAPPAVRALATTRAGGVSTGAFASLNLGSNTADAAANIARNRALLQAHCGADIIWLQQTHSTIVCELDPLPTTLPPGGDASVCRTPLRACAVLTADCLPVLLCDRAGSVVAAAHAGWRGLAAGILEATVAKMQCPAGEILAWLGPAIGGEVYEVGAEVRAAFVACDRRAQAAFTPAAVAGKWFANLYTLARQRLQLAGVGAVFGGGLCTASDAGRFYSWRRDGAETGRMASLVWLEDKTA